VAVSAFLCAGPISWSFPTAFLTGAAAATGIGLINSIGNLGGFVAPIMRTAINEAVPTEAGTWGVVSLGVSRLPRRGDDVGHGAVPHPRRRAARHPGAGAVKILVCDDDPTGTQSATGVEVLLRWDADVLTDALRRADAVYLLTNTRALDEQAAVALVSGIRADADVAGGRLGERVRLVLRGDSTLRGHVFAECDAVDPAAPVLFVPAFPGGGRTTVDGTHRVRVDGEILPAHETEFARDPVFGYRDGHLPGYVREKSARTPVTVGIDDVRSGALTGVLTGAGDIDVVLPDVHDDTDVARVADALRAAWATREIVARGGAPLAAAVCRVSSDGLLDVPRRGPGPGPHAAGVRLAHRRRGPAADVRLRRARCARGGRHRRRTLRPGRDRGPAGP
jgi:hypothetical protein